MNPTFRLSKIDPAWSEISCRLSKIQRELDWKPEVTLEEGLQQTIDWYTQNQAWWKPLIEKKPRIFSFSVSD